MREETHATTCVSFERGGPSQTSERARKKGNAMRVFSGRKGQGAAWQRRWVAWPFGVLLLLLGFLDGLLGALLVSVVVDDIKRRGPKQSPEPLGKGKLDRLVLRHLGGFGS